MADVSHRGYFDFLISQHEIYIAQRTPPNLKTELPHARQVTRNLPMTRRGGLFLTHGRGIGNICQILEGHLLGDHPES